MINSDDLSLLVCGICPLSLKSVNGGPLMRGLSVLKYGKTTSMLFTVKLGTNFYRKSKLSSNMLFKSQ